MTYFLYFCKDFKLLVLINKSPFQKLLNTYNRQVYYQETSVGFLKGCVGFTRLKDDNS